VGAPRALPIPEITSPNSADLSGALRRRTGGRVGGHCMVTPSFVRYRLAALGRFLTPSSYSQTVFASGFPCNSSQASIRIRRSLVRASERAAGYPTKRSPS